MSTCEIEEVNTAVWREQLGWPDGWETYLEALVLQHSFDGGILTRGREFGLEHNTEGTVADDLALCVGHLFRFAGEPILDLLPDHLCYANAISRDQCKADRLQWAKREREG